MVEQRSREEAEVEAVWQLQRRTSRYGLFNPRDSAVGPWAWEDAAALQDLLKEPLLVLGSRVRIDFEPKVSWPWLFRIAVLWLAAGERLGLKPAAQPGPPVAEETRAKLTDPFVQMTERTLGDLDETLLSGTERQLEAYLLAALTGQGAERDWQLGPLRDYLFPPETAGAVVRSPAGDPQGRLLLVELGLWSLKLRRWWAAFAELPERARERLWRRLWEDEGNGGDSADEMEYLRALAEVERTVWQGDLVPDIYAEATAAYNTVQANPKLRAIWERKAAGAVTHEEGVLLVRAAFASAPELQTEETLGQLRALWASQEGSARV